MGAWVSGEDNKKPALGGLVKAGVAMDEFQRRKITIDIESDAIGDRYFTPELARTLREIADLMEKDEAGRFEREVYRGPSGTLAVITATDVCGVCIPYRLDGIQCLPGGQQREKA